MASIRTEILTTAHPDAVWSAIRDIGALHRRLVPGFVVAIRLEPGARIVTFGNGMVTRETIVTLDEAERRLVWSAASPEKSLRNFGLWDKWIVCLTAGTVVPANQEKS